MRPSAFARSRGATRRWRNGRLDLIGLSAETAETYVRDFVASQVGRDDDAVEASLRIDLDRAKADLSDHRLRRKMDEEFAEALASIKSGCVTLTPALSREREWGRYPSPDCRRRWPARAG